MLWLVRRYRVRITEGFATVGHARFGEHPLGLAVDIEPGPGGTWADVARLARWAEPRQNRPRAAVPLGRLERRLQPRAPLDLQAAPRLRAAPAPVLVALADPRRAASRGPCWVFEVRSIDVATP